MKIKNIIFKLALIVMLVFVTQIGPTASYLSDIEESSDNVFYSSSLDLEFTSNVSEFLNGDAMSPGDTATREFVVDNNGDLPLEYSQQYSNPTGNLDLCNILGLRVTQGTTVLYNGLLSAYVSAGSSALLSGNTATFDYEVSLPLVVSSSLRNQTCQFDIEARAWQVGGTYGMGYYDTEYLTSIITTGNWPPPAPTLSSPADGTIAAVGSDWTNNPVMNWNDITWDDPSLYYIYQSSLTNTTNPDGSFTSPAYTSGSLLASEIPAPGTPNGTYYWHVRACDTTWGCGDWSSIWTLTVDNTVQEANAGEVVVNEIMWSGSTVSTADEWIELRNTTGSPINLKNWTIQAAGSGTSAIVIPSGILPANGYFMIANYSATNPASALAVEADFVSASFSLDNTGEQLTLRDAVGNTIDQTPSSGWAAGTNGAQKQSMERNSVPGDGTNAASWHTCIDAGCNDLVYWDSEADNYGTPKALNLSSNDPSDAANYIIPNPLTVPIEETIFKAVEVETQELQEPVVQEVVDPLPSTTPEPTALPDLFVPSSEPVVVEETNEPLLF